MLKNESQKKSKLISIILNILAIGAGYLYIGNLKKSFIIYPLLLCLTIVFYFVSTKISIGYFSILLYIIILGLWFYVIIDVFISIKNTQIINSKYSNPIYIFFYIIIFYLTVYLVSMYSPYKMYNIPAGSMKNTLFIGDRIIVNKLNKKIERGNIFAFQYPKNPNLHYAKRVIASGGDIVAFKDKNLLLHPNEGNNYVKNNYSPKEYIKLAQRLWLVNPYKKEHPGIHTDPTVIKNGLNPEQLFDMAPIKLKDNTYFVLGDNRDHSNDSRFWGVVPEELFIGRVESIFINFDNLTRSGIKINYK